MSDVDREAASATKVVYFVFKTLHEIMAEAEQNVKGSRRLRARRLRINSRVIAVSATGAAVHQSVRLTFK